MTSQPTEPKPTVTPVRSIPFLGKAITRFEKELSWVALLGLDLGSLTILNPPEDVMLPALCSAEANGFLWNVA